MLLACFVCIPNQSKFALSKLGRFVYSLTMFAFGTLLFSGFTFLGLG